jgi:glycosyltransferase involved in cell wall biosynthesis
MRKFHVGPFNGQSGISKYASDFYDLVLSDRGYIALDTDNALQTITNDDVVHIEIGTFCDPEIDLLYLLLDRGHKKIDVTLHDAPFIKWPYYKFRNRLVNNFSKFVHLYLRNFFIGDSVFKRIRRIYVLTHRGFALMRSRYGISNVAYIPHIVRTSILPNSMNISPNLLFFGFIGKNKGLDYALRLHESILANHPDIMFYVIGGATNPECLAYLDSVKSRYQKNIEYLGFVDELNLNAIFNKASVAILPYSDYKSVVPASGSIIKAMSLGKIICTTNVNAVSELIEHGETGYFLTGDYTHDVKLICDILSSPKNMMRIFYNSINFLIKNNHPDVVGAAFDRVDYICD